MRTIRVLTNETCDHRCSFCDTRRPHERGSIAAHAAVRRRIAEARGAAEIVLTGGEPTLRRDLPGLVAAAAATGARVILETHAAHIDETRARQLAAAGLAIARVHVPGIDAHAAITGDTSGWSRLVAGAQALHDAGVRVEATVPIVAATLPELAELPMRLRDAMPWLAAVLARIPTEAPDGAGLAPPAAAIAGFEQLAEGARTAELALQLDPATFFPPCLLARPARHAHAFALGPGASPGRSLVRVPACARCHLADRCPGAPPAWHAHATAHARPIVDDAVRRRLSIVRSVEAQIARELATDEVWRGPDGATVPVRIVRVGFRCNQACTFCFVSTHLPSAPADAIAAAIVEVAAQRGMIALSGGEPTLDPRLEHWVALAKAHGAREVELQTNATRLDDARVAALVTAGLDVAFVSLHGATAAICDAVTQAAGTFVQTLAGLDALARAGVRTRINFVLCRRNFAELPAFVELVAARWPRATLTISFVAPSTDLVPRTTELVPRYAEVLPAIVDALARATARGVEVGGFESMCGIPLCLVPRSLAPFLALAELSPAGLDAMGGGELIKPDACGRCVLESRCFGLRRGYAELYGTDELRPILHPADADRDPSTLALRSSESPST